jgi:hypothetical protein
MKERGAESKKAPGEAGTSFQNGADDRKLIVFKINNLFI